MQQAEPHSKTEPLARKWLSDESKEEKNQDANGEEATDLENIYTSGGPQRAQTALVPLDDIAPNFGRSFAELRDIWQRGHAADDTPKAIAIARNAFAKAIGIVDALEIIEAARTWRAACDLAEVLASARELAGGPRLGETAADEGKSEVHFAFTAQWQRP